MIPNPIRGSIVTAIFYSFAMVAAGLTGCGSEAGISQVHGTVTFEGKPVVKGTVRFFPKAGGRPAVGQIQTDGSYQLGTKVSGDGTSPGEYAIAVEAVESTTIGQAPTSLEEEMASGEAQVSVKYLVPEKYSSHQSSGLAKTVEPGDNEINLDLQ